MAPGRHRLQRWLTFRGALVALVLAQVRRFLAHVVRRLGGHLELDEAFPLALGRRWALELARRPGRGRLLALQACPGNPRCIHPAHLGVAS